MYLYQFAAARSRVQAILDLATLEADRLRVRERIRFGGGAVNSAERAVDLASGLVIRGENRRRPERSSSTPAHSHRYDSPTRSIATKYVCRKVLYPSRA